MTDEERVSDRDRQNQRLTIYDDLIARLKLSPRAELNQLYVAVRKIQGKVKP